MTGQELYIKLASVEKTYGGVPLFDNTVRRILGVGQKKRKKALKGIDLEIREGERVGIIGENGAGKSTLLKIIAGTVPPTSGAVDVNGNIHAVLTLGVGVRDELTGRENLYLDAEIHGKDRNEVEPIVEDMIEFTGLGEFIDRPVNTYSSGMKSRLLFSSLVFVEPEILILDETLSTGDQWFQARAKVALRNLCDKGKIVIVVSHSMAAIQDICSRCIWISDGAIVADGSPEEVIPKYVAFQAGRVNRGLSDAAKRDSHWTSGTTADVKTLKLCDPINGSELGDFTTGKGMLIEASLCGLKGLQHAKLELSINRLDGLIVLESHVDLTESIDLDKAEAVAKCIIDPLHLSPGSFECSLRLVDRKGLRAKRTKLFKMHSDNMPLGGHPLFFHPISIKAEV